MEEKIIAVKIIRTNMALDGFLWKQFAISQKKSNERSHEHERAVQAWPVISLLILTAFVFAARVSFLLLNPISGGRKEKNTGYDRPEDQRF